MASTYLTRTPASAGNRKTWTFSAWVKKSALGSGQEFRLLNSNNGSLIDNTIRFSNDILQVADYNSGYITNLETTAVFRDTSSWYHIVVSVDTTQATSSNRAKIYVNGSQVTTFNVATYPSQNTDWSTINTTRPQTIGRKDEGASQYFDGVMAHVHFIDGTVYDASTFGETDATTGIWKPKTAPSVTYGTNGFFLKFENSGAFGTDSSGNANNFTVNGTMTQTIDTPSNVFSTWNSLYNSNQNLSNGNLSATNATSTWNSRASTLAGSSGKYYAEYKINKPGTSYHMNGVGDIDYINPSSHAGAGTGMVAYYSDSGEKYISGTNTAYGDTYGDGDIISVALDLDNGYVYFAKNGTWQNSGVPTSGATGTGGIVLPTTGTYAFTESVRSASSSNAQVDANFGNGYFGTTAVASAQNPDDGIGIFEFTPPTGYKALCTKSINAQEYD